MKRQPATQFYDVEAIVEALGVSEKTVRRRIADGSLKAHRFGRLIRISAEDYRAFVALQRGTLESS